MTYVSVDPTPMVCVGMNSDRCRSRRPCSAGCSVETLFLATEPWCWEQLSGGATVVELGVDEAFAHCELLDRKAIHVLSARGDLYAVPAAEVPGGGDIAAIFRY